MRHACKWLGLLTAAWLLAGCAAAPSFKAMPMTYRVVVDNGTATVGLPSPKSNTTVPVGVPAPGPTGATVAVNATDSPTSEGSGTSVNTVVVAAAFTAWVPDPTDPEKFASPL